ncbi:MAG: ABC transporter ATP-binding protein [Gemmatimonadaceae bacterium]|nr:ABC transporter ATP-binding protein [Gemmatimonadaceae bacterium]
MTVTDSILSVRALDVTRPRSAQPALQGVTFAVAPGERIGIVGHSGAGKSTLASALLGLLPRDATLDPASEIHLGDTALHRADAETWRRARGARIALVMQEPMLALNPAMRIGAQVAEAATAHGIARDEADARMLEMLAKVGFGDPRAAARAYAHELSGGMRQRALIAAAMLMRPAVLIADEPTTALDPTIQAQVLDLLGALRDEVGTALLLISHDLPLVAERCDRVLRLEHGRLVEDDHADRVLARHHIRDYPTPSSGPVVPRAAAPPSAVLSVQDLVVRYGDVEAVRGVSFQLARGEALGIVGESGCGKSSVAHAVTRLVAVASGRVTLTPPTASGHAGTLDLLALSREPLRRARRHIQLIPQDAGASLTPHLTAEALVAEGLEVHGLAQGATALARARSLLAELGIGADLARRQAQQLSTGERQRVAIARAIAVEPAVLICDEPLAAVDEATRERIIEALETRRRGGIALVIISHDLPAVRRLAPSAMVMYLGRVVEHGATAEVLVAPQMPYAQALVSAIPTGDRESSRRRIVLHGEVPSPAAPPSGCAFHPRCPHPQKDDRCSRERPALVPIAPDHLAACWKLPLPPSR